MSSQSMHESAGTDGHIDVFVFKPSYAQKRLWFLSQLYPESAAYNILTTLEIEGRLSATALEGAWVEVERRHEILRTNLDIVDDSLAQIIRETMTERDDRGRTVERVQVTSDDSTNRVVVFGARTTVDGHGRPRGDG